MKHEGLDTFLGYFSVCVYEDAVIQNRKLLNQDEISVYTLKELLLKIYKIDLNVLESCSIFIRANQTIEQVSHTFFLSFLHFLPLLILHHLDHHFIFDTFSLNLKPL